MKFNIAILEDIESQSKNLIHLLTEWGKLHNHIIDTVIFSSSVDFIEKVDFQKYTICFLDISLEEEETSGLDVAKKLRARHYTGELIFLTSYREYVFEGYNVNAFNFLLKPLSLELLTPVMNALAEKYSDHYYTIKSSTNYINIPYHDIIAISASLHDITITTTKEIYQDHIGLNTIARHLPAQFVQCHRSSIINMMHIQKLESNKVYLTGNLTQTIGRTYLKEVRRKFAMHIMKMNGEI